MIMIKALKFNVQMVMEIKVITMTEISEKHQNCQESKL